jgi:hypothetical protein
MNLVLGLHHRRDHVVDLGEAGGTEIHTHDLADPHDALWSAASRSSCMAAASRSY